jgi:hypothetical protein
LTAIAEGPAKGFRKAVLMKGTYLVSPKRTLRVPTGFTLDLGGATVKMEPFTGDHAMIIEIAEAVDSHVVNGTVVGDREGHDYENSKNSSEWVNGVSIMGDSRYCSFENVTVRDITGYGGACGISMSRPISSPIVFLKGKFTHAGELDMKTGDLIAGVPERYTCGFTDISGFTNGWLDVAAYLGYQGRRSQTWNIIVAFYGADKTFLSAEHAFQFRHVRIPEGAKHLRVTICETTAEAAAACDLCVQCYAYPWNCAFRRMTFDRCRAVGFAPAAMRNLVFEDSVVSRSGETLAKCAIDAEDGWDLMQDVAFRRLCLVDNPNAQMVICGGHDFVIEDNDADFHVWGRSGSPCVRRNRGKRGIAYCDSRLRTMYARYSDNALSDTFSFGMDGKRNEDGWDITMAETVFSLKNPLSPRSVVSGTGRRFRGCTFDGTVPVSGPRFADCTIADLNIGFYWPYELVNTVCTNVSFNNCNEAGTFSSCTLIDSRIGIGAPGSKQLTLVDSTLVRSPIEIGWWTKPSVIRATRCRFLVDGQGRSAFRTPTYAIRDIRVENCVFETSTEGASAVTVFDARTQPTDAEPGSVLLTGNKFIGPFGPLVNITDTVSENAKPLTFTGRGNVRASAAKAKPVPDDRLAGPDGVRASWKVGQSGKKASGQMKEVTYPRQCDGVCPVAFRNAALKY